MLIWLRCWYSVELLTARLLVCTTATVTHIIVSHFYPFQVLFVNILLLTFHRNRLVLLKVYVLLVWYHFLIFVLRILGTLVSRMNHVHLLLLVGKSLCRSPSDSEVIIWLHTLWIHRRINNLRKVSFSSSFLCGCALLWRLWIYLLLLHRVILLTVIDW